MNKVQQEIVCNDMYVYKDSVVEYEVKFNVHAQTVQ